MIRNHKSSKLITCETTPQHLLMKSPDIYKEIGSFAQMNPPIKRTTSKRIMERTDGWYN